MATDHDDVMDLEISEGNDENSHVVDVTHLDMLITRGHSYICPITRKIINDPVYIENDSRYYFERDAIERHFEKDKSNP